MQVDDLMVRDGNVGFFSRAVVPILSSFFLESATSGASSYDSLTDPDLDHLILETWLLLSPMYNPEFCFSKSTNEYFSTSTRSLDDLIYTYLPT